MISRGTPMPKHHAFARFVDLDRTCTKGFIEDEHDEETDWIGLITIGKSRYPATGAKNQRRSLRSARSLRCSMRGNRRTSNYLNTIVPAALGRQELRARGDRRMRNGGPDVSYAVFELIGAAYFLLAGLLVANA